MWSTKLETIPARYWASMTYDVFAWSSIMKRARLCSKTTLMYGTNCWLQRKAWWWCRWPRKPASGIIWSHRHQRLPHSRHAKKKRKEKAMTVSVHCKCDCGKAPSLIYVSWRQAWSNKSVARLLLSQLYLYPLRQLDGLPTRMTICTHNLELALHCWSTIWTSFWT